MKIERRIFLAGLGAAGLGAGLGGFSHLFPLESPTVGPDWRPGDEDWVPSTCLLCPAHCGIMGRVVDGSLVSVDGNPLHPISRGGLCPKGKAGLQLLYHPARIGGPLERNGAAGSDGFGSVGWEPALARVADTLGTLRQAGRSSAVAWLAGDVGATVGELLDRFVRIYGSGDVMREGYADGSEEVMWLTQGVRAQPAFDIERSDLIVSFGAPLAEAWWCLPQAARARDLPADEGRRWVQIDTRLSRTAAAADEWLPVRPGSYGALALAIAYVMLKEGLYDAEWIRQGVTGFDDWEDSRGQLTPGYRNLILRHGRPDDLAERIGLPPERIVELAKQFGRAQRPVAVWDHAVSWRRGGLADGLAIHALNVLVGSLQRPGGVFLPPTSALPSLEQMAPLQAAPPAKGESALAVESWADAILEDRGPPIEVLFLYHSNPVASSAEPDKVRRALEKVPLVVSFSPFLDESARYADLVLPDHTYLERWQDGLAPATVPYPVWGVVQPLVEPLHDTRATGDVILDLASRVGAEVADACPWSSVEALLRERSKALAAKRRGSSFVTAFRREELRELEARGWWIPHGESPDRFWNGVRESGGWFDPYFDDHQRPDASRRPDGKSALFPEDARWKIAGALPGLEEGFLPLAVRGETSAGAEDAANEDYPLLLMPYRVMTLASGTTPLMPWLLEHLGPLTVDAWEPWIEINPETGHELGLDSDRIVEVQSEHGVFRARLRFYEGAQPGVVNAPYGLHSSVAGWGRVEPANPLAAVGTGRDPITNLPDWYTTRVRLNAV